MAKEFSKGFYNSKTWKNCREAYLRKQCFMCERCGGVAKIVHHKEYIDVANCHNPEILTDFKNLEALCQKCHNDEHGVFKNKSRYEIGVDGRPIIKH